MAWTFRSCYGSPPAPGGWRTEPNARSSHSASPWPGRDREPPTVTEAAPVS
jgi:hypothetical protein